MSTPDQKQFFLGVKHSQNSLHPILFLHKNIQVFIFRGLINVVCYAMLNIYTVNIYLVSRSTENKVANKVSFCVVLLFPVWIVYEQVMIAALDCSRDDLAWVSSISSSLILSAYDFNSTMILTNGSFQW